MMMIGVEQLEPWTVPPKLWKNYNKSQYLEQNSSQNQVTRSDGINYS